MMSAETNTKIHLIVGGLLALGCWALDQFGGVKIPAEIGMGAGLAVETLVLFLLPANLINR